MHLVKLQITCTSIMTIEVRSLEEAERVRRETELAQQSHCHHGEQVTVTVREVVQPQPLRPDNLRGEIHALFPSSDRGALHGMTEDELEELEGK